MSSFHLSQLLESWRWTCLFELCWQTGFFRFYITSCFSFSLVWLDKSHLSLLPLPTVCGFQKPLWVVLRGRPQNICSRLLRKKKNIFFYSVSRLLLYQYSRDLLSLLFRYWNWCTSLPCGSKKKMSDRLRVQISMARLNRILNPNQAEVSKLFLLNWQGFC